MPIHADLRSGELAYLIGHSEMSLAVVLPNREGALRLAQKRVDLINSDAALPAVQLFV